MGSTFEPEAKDDFSAFRAASFPVGAARELGRARPEPGEVARYEAKQVELVTHFTHARQADAVHWLRS